MSEYVDIHTPEQQATQELNDFLDNPGLSEIVTLFSSEELPQDTTQRLAMLGNIATQYWDFRKGAERQTVNWDDNLLDQEGSEQWNAIFTAANKLGLVQNTESINKTPRTLAILGGANHAPYDRLKYGLGSVDDFDALVYLGSAREVSDAERQKAVDYAPNARTEFDLGCGAIEKLLNAERVDMDNMQAEYQGETWDMHVYEFEWNGQDKLAYVLNTPKMIESRRATTYDNYRYFAEVREIDKNPDQPVVAVTTGFYTRAQHFPAVQELTLPYGTQVETIGHSAEYAGNVRKPSQLLQETKSAIDAAVRLEQAINDVKE